MFCILKLKASRKLYLDLEILGFSRYKLVFPFNVLFLLGQSAHGFLPIADLHRSFMVDRQTTLRSIQVETAGDFSYRDVKT